MAAVDWRVVYLRALGAKPTQPALDFLAKWQPFEGGHTNNDAKFNYLNTTTSMPGSTSINSVGVKRYSSLAQGAQAFARTLKGTYAAQYAPLTQFLLTGKGDPSRGLSMWLSGSPDSSGGLKYAAKVMGGTAAGSSNGRTPGPDPGNVGSTPTPAVQTVPLTQHGGADMVRQQALAGLGRIASGESSSTDEFAMTAPMMKSLLEASKATPQPAAPPPTPAAANSSVEGTTGVAMTTPAGSKSPIPTSAYDAGHVNVSGFTSDFASRLAALIQASGGRLRINSGYRSPKYQAKLYAAALKKYGSEHEARRWVAPPGKSNHGKGFAADIGGDLEWAHANAARFGLAFPMAWENWHIEPAR